MRKTKRKKPAFRDKLSLAARRISFFLRDWPKRLERLGRHLLHARYLLPGLRGCWWNYPLPLHYGLKAGFWFAELALYLLDLLGCGECYNILTDSLKPHSRPLDKRERRLAEAVYGASLRHDLAALDEKAWVGFRIFPMAHAYVGCHTINSHGQLSDEVLLHELAHVWQYQRFGSVYALRALAAQHSEAGYDYGGAEGLRRAAAKGKDLFHFNFEQQGDIVQDYYRISCGLPPQWGNGSLVDLPLYERFVRDFRLPNR